MDWQAVLKDCWACNWALSVISLWGYNWYAWRWSKFKFAVLGQYDEVSRFAAYSKIIDIVL